MKEERSDPAMPDSSKIDSGPIGTTLLAEQLAELAALTGGLAHEIRNPLSTLKVNLQLLDEDWRRIESSDPSTPRDTQDVARRSRRRVETLLKEADRLEQILHDFLQYIGRRDLSPAPHDLNHIVSELADFYRPQAQAGGVDFQVTLHPQPLVCRVDVNYLKQALLNLLINAQQAMPGGGELRLALSVDESRQARIDLSDTGPGVPDDEQDRIFRAYYSTKKGGTGLGLATARRIVREHGGRIAVRNNPTAGATFSILLPVS